jgi:hypothetical protein
MKTLLNLTKVINVKVFGLEDLSTDVVKLIVNYFNNEPSFELIVDLTELCDESKKQEKERVEKAYDEIKQALLKGEKYVEIEL